MNEMNIESAQYVAFESNNVSIRATIDGIEIHVPLIEGNRHYDEIMRQVESGILTISNPVPDAE